MEKDRTSQSTNQQQREHHTTSRSFAQKNAEPSHYQQQQQRQQQQQQQDQQNQQMNNDRIALHKSRSRNSLDPTEYGDDEEEVDDEAKFHLDEMRYSDARMGICSVCYFSLKSSEATPEDFDKALLCSDGHLLCHRCVQRYAIQSDTNCVLCAAVESQQFVSSNNTSRASSDVKINVKSSSKSKQRNSRTSTDRRGHRRSKRAAVMSPPRTNVVVAAHYEANNFVITESGPEENWEENTEYDEYEEEDEEKATARVPTNIKTRSYCSLVHKDEQSSSIKAQINSQMMSECSRRPIQCPLPDCAVNVAFSALTNHFLFDHPEVPILSVDPGEKSTLIVNFDGLVYDSSRCLALLLVSGKLSGPAAKQFNGSHVHPRYKNRLPLPILAARLHCNATPDGEVNAAGEGTNSGGDVVIAWVAGLDIGNTTAGALRCSIQAIDSIDNEAFRSLTYTGPINSLRTAQKPREVFLTGDCVILHDGFINHITSGCENLNVNITIH